MLATKKGRFDTVTFLLKVDPPSDVHIQNMVNIQLGASPVLYPAKKKNEERRKIPDTKEPEKESSFFSSNCAVFDVCIVERTRCLLLCAKIPPPRNSQSVGFA